jgi:signal transduction histidine kinase
MSAKSTDPKKLFEHLKGSNQQVEALARQFLSSLCQSHELINDHVRLLTSILESMNDGLVVVDTTNQLRLTNSAAVRISGFHPEEDWKTQIEENYRFFDGVTGAPITFGEGIVAASLQDRKPREAEWLVRSERLPNGEAFWRLSTAPIVGDDGSLHGAVTVFQDISEAKAAANKVWQLYNGAPCGYHSLTENGIFAEINDTELGWLGVTRDSVIHKAKFSTFLTRKSHPIFTKNFATLIAEGSVNNVELELVDPSGEIRNALWSSVAITDKKGKLLTTRCTLFDITERSRLQKDLDALAGLIAHDVKNHMVATAGVLELISEDPECRIGPDTAPVVQSLRISNQDQLQALNNLINLWAARKRAENEEINVSTLVNDAVSLVADAAKLRNVKISVHVDKNLPMIWVPPTAMRHVIGNLLHNGIKYSKHSQSVQASAHAEAGGVTIVISDNGPGMTKKELDNLFKVRTDISPVGFSSGLGLHFCQQIVQGAGGTLRCESEKGNGTRFFLHHKTKPTENP